LKRYKGTSALNHKPAIIAEDLVKSYALYSSPKQMFLDKVGLGRFLRCQPSRHLALDQVSLEIRRREKVALIGRNGAGKSTFLKLISGVTAKTSGHLDVNGRVHALFSIGTGFHPDLTGRENVYTYLANRCLAGR